MPALEQRPGVGRLREFWRRVTEGMQLEELWTQFASEARATYGFYSQDVDWEAVKRASRWRRPFHIAKVLFWALVINLSSARRVLLLLLAGIEFRLGASFRLQSGDFRGLAILILFLLLALELADRVMMKRDLEIAREIQQWLVPEAPPAVPGVDLAFATRQHDDITCLVLRVK